MPPRVPEDALVSQIERLYVELGRRPTQREWMGASGHDAKVFARYGGFCAFAEPVCAALESETAAYLEPSIPARERTMAQIIESRKEEFARRDANEEAQKRHPVRLKEKGPYCLLFFGDPHIDNPGADIGLLEQHLALLDNPHVYGLNAGDVTDNWSLPKLAHLHAESTTTASEAWMLVEWLLGTPTAPRKWLALVGGNHDLWNSGEHLYRWLARQRRQKWTSSIVHLALHSPGAADPVTITLAHDLPGRSIYNDTHAHVRLVRDRGIADDITVTGHRHVSAYSCGYHEATGTLLHNAQVGSYKRHDDFGQRQLKAPQRNHAPCVGFIVQPGADLHRRVVFCWSPEEAVSVMQWKRGKRAA